MGSSSSCCWRRKPESRSQLTWSSRSGSVHPTQQQESTPRHGHVGERNAEREFERKGLVAFPDGDCLGREYLAKDSLRFRDARWRRWALRLQCALVLRCAASSCFTQRAQVAISSRLSTASTSRVVSAGETSAGFDYLNSWPRSRKASISCCCAGVMRSKPVSSRRAGCLHLAGDYGLVQHQRQLARLSHSSLRQVRSKARAHSRKLSTSGPPSRSPWRKLSAP